MMKHLPICKNCGATAPTWAELLTECVCKKPDDIKLANPVNGEYDRAQVEAFMREQQTVGRVTRVTSAALLRAVRGTGKQNLASLILEWSRQQPESEPVMPEKVEWFEEAFQIVFEGSTRPGTDFASDSAWAIWQHAQLTKAFSLLQKVRRP